MTAALAHRRHRIKAACLRAADAARAPMRAVWLKKADDAIRLPPDRLNAPVPAWFASLHLPDPTKARR